VGRRVYFLPILRVLIFFFLFFPFFRLLLLRVKYYLTSLSYFLVVVSACYCCLIFIVHSADGLSATTSLYLLKVGVRSAYTLLLLVELWLF